MSDNGYGKASLEEIQKRYDSSGKGDRVWIIDPSIPTYKMRQGYNVLRILPPLRDGTYFGEDVWIHTNVGILGDSFVCKAKTDFIKETCVICNEYKRLKDKGITPEELRGYEPSKKTLFNVGDVENPEDGVQVLVSPITISRGILRISKNRKTHKTEDISNPENGYDVAIERTGEGLKNTRYPTIIRDSEEPKPVKEPKWLSQLFDLRKVIVYPLDEDIVRSLGLQEPETVRTVREPDDRDISTGGMEDEVARKTAEIKRNLEARRAELSD